MKIEITQNLIESAVIENEFGDKISIWNNGKYIPGGKYIKGDIKSKNLYIQVSQSKTQRIWARILLGPNWINWNDTFIHYNIKLHRIENNKYTHLCSTKYNFTAIKQLKVFFNLYPGLIKFLGHLILNYCKPQYDFYISCKYKKI